MLIGKQVRRMNLNKRFRVQLGFNTIETKNNIDRFRFKPTDRNRMIQINRPISVIGLLAQALSEHLTKVCVELESKLNTRSRRHQPVWMGPNEERTDALCGGERKRNIAIPCTFWSALQIIHNMVSSNIARCM